MAAATAADATAKSVPDGRVLRGERNRAAIVTALLDLLSEGVVRPSAREVAERAGVSLRSVFQHFDDMEALHAECVTQQLAKFADYVQPIAASGPTRERVAAVVAQRTRLYEAVAPVRRAAMFAAMTSPTIKEGLDRTSRQLREVLTTTFAPELAGPDRKERLAAIEVATSFPTWDHLRQTQGLSAPAAGRVVTRLVLGVLEGERS